MRAFSRLAVLIPLVLALGGIRAAAAGSPRTSPRGAPAAPAALPLVGQRALYRLVLSKPRPGGVVAGSGTMGFEVVDACGGWAVRQRLDMTLVDADGQVTHTRSDYATWEAKDGLRFRFHSLDLTNGEVTDRLAGSARLERTGGPGTVTYSEPGTKTMKLPPGTLFPMAQTEAIIEAGRAGKKFMASPLFDGTDDSGASYSSVAIAGWSKPGPSHYAALSGLPSTRVSVAFFSRKRDAMLPDFEIGMRYYVNGVADQLVMNFGGFTMLGRMMHLAVLPSHCPG
ncbi:MAG: EipB family protein [Acetobacteraceae bacterium]